MTRSPLFEQPRSQPAAVIPNNQEYSLLDWLKTSGRLVARNSQETEYPRDEEDPEITGLIDTEEIADDFEDLGNEDDLALDEQ